MKKRKLEKLLFAGTLAVISSLNPVNAHGQEEQKENKKIELNLEKAIEKNSNPQKINEFRIGGFNVQLSDTPRIFSEAMIYGKAKLFTELYYNRNCSENVIGTNARLQLEKIEFSLGGKISISDSYSFRKYGISPGVAIDLNLFKFGIGYNLDIDACNGKKEDSFSFNASFNL